MYELYERCVRTLTWRSLRSCFRKKVKVFATVISPSLFGDSQCQETLPDVSSRGLAERFIIQRKMYSARDGVVNPFDPLGREIHDPLIILQRRRLHREMGFGDALIFPQPSTSCRRLRVRWRKISRSINRRGVIKLEKM